MKAGDTVITFNYDRVLNLLNEHLVGLSETRSLLRSPVGCPSFDEKREGVIPVYHLHGHVGWQVSADGNHCEPDGPNGIRADRARAHLNPAKALMGTPGKAKTSLHTGALKDCWQRAMGAIRDATSIVFVGYRFPETDNLAKLQLADALRQNPEARVHVVLGANNADTPRLAGMIGWTRTGSGERGPTLIHEMLCQDFFAVFERREL